MRRTMGVMVVLAALVATGAVDLSAQGRVEARAEAARPGPRAPSTEAILRMRDRLELTEQQIVELDEIRRASVARRSAEAAELAELRSRLQAGQIRRSEVMAYLEERREADASVAEERWSRIEGVLDEAQLATVEEMRGRARAFARGRATGRRGEGMRGPRRGWGDGDGFGPSRRDFRRGGPPRGGFGPGAPGFRRFDGEGTPERGAEGASAEQAPPSDPVRPRA